jgi:hypothetical protein
LLFRLSIRPSRYSIKFASYKYTPWLAHNVTARWFYIDSDESMYQLAVCASAQLAVVWLQPAEWMMSGTLGALAVVAAAVVRIYLGWAYVGNRLLSAAVEYEETGWWAGSCRPQAV